ncbi:MAG: M20/M25/M40 family metallo-hydrolase [Prevotellaceae bacterium]|jgi:acetylornithine deacetylase|nr:M20/M25/M40 family metallo-hydrolase [Prevotellaceae bacterium]
MTYDLQLKTANALALLKGKIAIPACSGAEAAAAGYLEACLAAAGAAPFRIGNNVCAYSKSYSKGKKSLLLNSHIDTVKAADGYTMNPFEPVEKNGKLYGLGANDAGASLVALVETFLHFNTLELPFNLLLVLSSEEENSGAAGIASVTREIKDMDSAVIGEPTLMKAATGERGLLVLDGTAHGATGHAARNEGVNAIYGAMEDIAAIRDYTFDRVSPLMGEVKKNVTMINAGYQHNVIPDCCRFVVDVRPNECYTNREILELLQAGVKSELKARSLHNRCSFTPAGHPLLQCVERLAIPTFISPTTSDWMRLDIPAIKMGPGDSARSHTADEFVYIHEIEEGIKGYIRFISQLSHLTNNHSSSLISNS